MCLMTIVVVKGRIWVGVIRLLIGLTFDSTSSSVSIGSNPPFPSFPPLPSLLSSPINTSKTPSHSKWLPFSVYVAQKVSFASVLIEISNLTLFIPFSWFLYDLTLCPPVVYLTVAMDSSRFIVIKSHDIKSLRPSSRLLQSHSSSAINS